MSNIRFARRLNHDEFFADRLGLMGRLSGQGSTRFCSCNRQLDIRLTVKWTLRLRRRSLAPLAVSLRAAIQDTPVVCLLWPRQSGKSTLVQQLGPRYAYVSFDDAAPLAFVQSDPAGFIAALPDPVILDEIQRVPELLRSSKMSDPISPWLLGSSH